MAQKGQYNHNEWIEYQYKKALRPCFRDVLIHTSFIENIVRMEADPNNKGKLNFAPAIRRLIAMRERCNKYKDDKLDEITKLWRLRNEIVHEILRSELKEVEIISKIKEMFTLIKDIYRESKFLQQFFGKYNLKLASEIKKLDKIEQSQSEST